MKPSYNLEARKRPVNLTLNEDLVSRAKEMTDNLSGVVESLLSDYVAKEQSRQAEKRRKVESAMTAWNAFNARQGSFSDEYSTL